MKKICRKHPRGLTLIEAVVAFAIISLVAFLFLSIAVHQFGSISSTKNMTEEYFLAMKGMENNILEVKTALDSGDAPENCFAEDYRLFGVEVSGYQVTEAIKGRDGLDTNKVLHTVVAEQRLEGFPAPQVTLSAELRDHADTDMRYDIVYASNTSAYIGTTVAPETPDDEDVFYVATYRWYVSRPGFNALSIGEDTSFTPSFPNDFEVISGETLDKLTIGPAYANRVVVVLVTPYSKWGKAGPARLSEPFYIMGDPPPMNAACVLHLDAGYVGTNLDTSSVPGKTFANAWRDLSKNGISDIPSLGGFSELAKCDFGSYSTVQGNTYRVGGNYVAVTGGGFISSDISFNGPCTLFVLAKKPDGVSGNPVSVRAGSWDPGFALTSEWAVYDAVSPGSPGGVPVYIGGGGDVDIATVIVYNRELTPDKRLEVRTYLEKKYGLS